MKTLKRITCTLLTAILLTTTINIPVLAAEQTDVVELEATIVAIGKDTSSSVSQRSTTFDDATVNFSFSSAGLHITIDTGTTMTASVIGVKDIKIQKKGLLGIWSTVATSEGGEAYNTNFMSVSLTYSGAIVGENYRVICTHYANVDGYRELEHETESITFNY